MNPEISNLLSKGNVIAYPATVANFSNLGASGLEIPSLQLKVLENKLGEKSYMLSYWIQQQQLLPASKEGNFHFTATQALNLGLAKDGISKANEGAFAKMEVETKLDPTSPIFTQIIELFNESGTRGESKTGSGNSLTAYSLKAKDIKKKADAKKELDKVNDIVSIINSRLAENNLIIGRVFSYFEGLPVILGIKENGTSMPSLLYLLKDAYKENGVFSSYSKAVFVNPGKQVFADKGYISLKQNVVRTNKSVVELLDDLCKYISGTPKDILETLATHTPSLSSNEEFVNYYNNL